MNRRSNRAAPPAADEKAGSRAGILYVVATPIGNLEDITLRALRILKEVDLIASEDTRHTRKLLGHFNIHKPLLSYYKEKEASRSEEIVALLKEGRNVALVSDAGTPCISDPGGILVRRACEQGLPVVPVPGPSALASALSVCGLDCPSHIFLGFLPAKAGERRKTLVSLRQERHCLVFYESPRRIDQALADCEEILGDRKCTVGRELTKIHEELLRGGISEIRRALQGKDFLKGEFVVLLEGLPGEALPVSENLAELLAWYRDNTDLSMRDAVKRLSKDLEVSRSEAYRIALEVWESDDR